MKNGKCTSYLMEDRQTAGPDEERKCTSYLMEDRQTAGPDEERKVYF